MMNKNLVGPVHTAAAPPPFGNASSTRKRYFDAHHHHSPALQDLSNARKRQKAGFTVDDTKQQHSNHHNHYSRKCYPADAFPRKRKKNLKKIIIHVPVLPGSCKKKKIFKTIIIRNRTCINKTKLFFLCRIARYSFFFRGSSARRNGYRNARCGRCASITADTSSSAATRGAGTA